MAACQPLHSSSQKPLPARSINPGYFLSKSVGIWLAIGSISLALLHLICCSPRGAQEAAFTQVLQYANDAYSKLRSSRGGQPCDYSEGQWVWAPGHARRYNATVCNVKQAQDCLRNGRPDTGYLDWRWQPAGCPLPAFDAAAFLSAVRGKHVAIIGDSMARNQGESLACLLTAGAPYRVVHRDPDYKRHFMRWAFPTHDVTLSVYWAPFLARATGKCEDYSMPDTLVHLDVPADRWAADADTIDVAVLAAGHWLVNPAIYHNGSEVVGAHAYPDLNHTEIGYATPLRQVYRMSLERLSSGGRPRTVVVATFSPTHFETHRMDDPMACAKKEPYKEGEKELGGMDKELRSIVIEEAEAAAQRNGNSGAVRIEVLDVTKLAAMRPDGHPGPYMHHNPFANGVPEKMPTDCLHFCLPGPADTFNEILQQILMKGRYN